MILTVMKTRWGYFDEIYYTKFALLLNVLRMAVDLGSPHHQNKRAHWLRGRGILCPEDSVAGIRLYLGDRFKD